MNQKLFRNLRIGIERTNFHPCTRAPLCKFKFVSVKENQSKLFFKMWRISLLCIKDNDLKCETKTVG